MDRLRKAQENERAYPQFDVNPDAVARAQAAEAQLPPAQRGAAALQRERIKAGVRSPMRMPENAGAEEPLADADRRAALDEYLNTFLANYQDTRRMALFAHTVALRAKNRMLREKMDQLSASPSEELADKGIQAFYGLLFQGGGSIDIVGEDGGITYAAGTAGSLYQLLLTIFPTWNEKVQAMPFGKYLPQKFDLKTIRGWGQLVDAAVLFLWFGVILVILLFIVVVIIAIAQHPLDFLQFFV